MAIIAMVKSVGQFQSAGWSGVRTRLPRNVAGKGAEKHPRALARWARLGDI
ncbi:MAG: hypothetical protein U1F68_20435 [Gammaproteobacteria bacterium]